MAFIVRKRVNSATIMRKHDVPVKDGNGERIGYNPIFTTLGSIPLDAVELPRAFVDALGAQEHLTPKEEKALEEKLFAPAREARDAKAKAEEEERSDPLRRLKRARSDLDAAARLSVKRPIPVEELALLEASLLNLVTQGSRDWLREVSQALKRARTHFVSELGARAEEVSFTDNPIAQSWALMGSDFAELRACLQELRWVRSAPASKQANEARLGESVVRGRKSAGGMT